MIGLDTWEGFVILLIVPLLYWHQRSRSAPREVFLSIYPVVTGEAPEDLPRPRRFLRLTRNQRFVLFTGALLCLALGYNGFHFSSRSEKAGEWLIFLDNTPGLTATFRGKTVSDEITSHLRIFSEKVHDEDTFILVTTSPAPLISDRLDAGAFRKALNGIEASPSSGSVGDLASLLRVMSEGSRFKGSILLTPRSKVWKEKIPSGVTVPADKGNLSGNAGIVHLEATPVAEDLYDIYGRITSDGLEARTIETTLRTEDGREESLTVPLDKKGEGEFRFTQTMSPSSRATLDLLIDDALQGDNSAALISPGSTGQTHIRITGDQNPFLMIALTSHRDFAITTGRNPGEPTGYGVTVLNGVASTKSVDSPTLVIYPPEDLTGFNLIRVWAAPMDVSFHPGHPATENARFRQFRAAGILQTSYPENFEILAAAGGIPMILAGTLNGHRTIVWNFDPEDNGIYLDPAFPVLLRDTVNWLAQSRVIKIETEGCADGRVDPRTCSSMIKEAAAVNVPDLKRLGPETLGPDSENRRDLGKESLFFALILILILAMERVHIRRTDR